MTEAKREEIKGKVAAAEARQLMRGPVEAPSHTLLERAGESAIEAKDKAAEFVKKHPVASVAGAIALGVLISGLFRNSPTRKAGRKAGVKAAGLAAIGAEFAKNYALKAWDAAGTAKEEHRHDFDELGTNLRKRGRHLQDRASHLAHDASERAHSYSDRARKAVRRRLRNSD